MIVSGVSGGASTAFIPRKVTVDSFGLAPDTAVSQLLTVGAWRIGSSAVAWNALNTASGTYDFTALDAYLDAVPSTVNDVIYIVNRVPGWANGSQASNVPPTDYQSAYDFSTKVCQHNMARSGRKFNVLETWNEPTLTQFWTGTVAQNGLMSAGIARAALAVDPSMHILVPASSTNTLANLPALYSNFSLRSIAYNTHLYDATPETMYAVAVQSKALGGALAPGAPQWVTETAWGENGDLANDNARAGAVAWIHTILLGLGYSKVLWYQYSGNASSSTEFGTLYNTNGTLGLTAAGVAYQQYQAWTIGAVIRSLDVSGTVWKSKITRTGYSGVIVWDSSGDSSYTPDAGITQYRDLAGNVTPYSSGTVTIGVSPILFETGTP